MKVAHLWQFVFWKLDLRPLCIECEREFEQITEPICLKCGRPQKDNAVCSDCVEWERRLGTERTLRQNRSIFLYNDWMKELMNRYKFRGDAILAQIFQSYLQQAKKRYFPHALTIIPIPLAEDRLLERGFNQALLLAQLLNLPIIEPLKKGKSSKQSKKSRHERIHSKNPFFVSDPQLVIGKSILLIDDIYTTGTTLHQAALKLYEAGAKDVQSLTLIRG